MYALLLIRVIALVCSRSRTTRFSPWQPLPWFADLSTSTICFTLLTNKNDTGGDWEWPVTITSLFMTQLKDYISKIVSLYKDVPYHNFEHAYHVFISANKLLDLVLCECNLPPISDHTKSNNNSNGTNGTNGTKPAKNEANRIMKSANKNTSGAKCTSHSPTSKYENNKPDYHDKPSRPTYGIKRDPLVQLAFLFSALVHDVEHSGVSNRQLVLEGDELAIMYNDQSVAEQRSLAVAFSLIRESQYSSLRKLLFEHGKDGIPGDSYMRFRSTVIDLVLCTDIASPERVQIVKSKFKEAFGDAHKRAASSRSNGTTHGKQPPNRNLQESNPVIKFGQSERSIFSDFLDSRNSLQGEKAMFCNNLPTTKEVDSSSSSSSGNERETTWTSEHTDFKQREILFTNLASKIKNTCRTMSDDISRKRTGSNLSERPEKRLSTPSVCERRKSIKLGIRRTLDLDGAAIEPFRGSKTIGEMVGDIDQPNDLKMIAILEQMLKAADISTNLQCWDNMIFSSTRLFKELRASFCDGRGDNPGPGWFDNQRAFIESYTLPLARRLVEAGVFQKDFGQLLVNCAEQNRLQWAEEGSSVCISMNADGLNKVSQDG